MQARQRQSIRVLLISPLKRVLLFKYKNLGQDGIERPHWTTIGGGRDDGEMIEQAAAREIVEETGMTDVRLGPIVWYGEDGERSGDGKMLLKEHFVVVHAVNERLDTSRWSDWERDQIISTRWWTPDELRLSAENIFPRNLAALLEPILAGIYPATPIILPPI
jgi:ADP-ribose pyrophosphatase YjhB (NUDIX family)